jgi:hypothetical protein
MPVTSADGGRVSHAGDEHAVGARIEERPAALDRDAEPRFRRAKPRGEAVGAGVDHDAHAGLGRRLMIFLILST